MLGNYFRTAFRRFSKNKITTLINILGLSIGIGASLIIFMTVRYDYSFDKFEPARDRIYRVVTDGDGWKNRGIPVPFPQALMQNASGLETIVSLFEYNDWNTKVLIPDGGNQSGRAFKNQEEIVFTDENYFSVFPHRWIAGSPKQAFQKPYQLVLSESRAREYFPGIPFDRMLGRRVVLSDTVTTTVTGIVADLAANSDFNYQSFISLKTVLKTTLKAAYQVDQWGSTSSSNQLIVKLAPHVEPETVNKQINRIFKEQQSNREDSRTVHRLQPLADVHVNPDYEGEVDLSILRNLIILAVFLLMLGMINFVNLSTAHASERAKEIGIRQTLGSRKTQLMSQFLAETFLLTLFATVLSLALVPILLKAFGQFIPEGLDVFYLFKDPFVWIFLVVLSGVVTVIAGIYPAFVLTSFKPVSALKNIVINNSGSTRSGWLRKVLVVSQFVIAQVFITAVVVVDRQVQYAVRKEMGFRKDAIINFQVPNDFASPNNKKLVLKNELRGITGIEAVSLGNQPPAFNGSMTMQITYKEKGGKEMREDVASRNGDTDFLKVYHIDLVAGRNIVASDTANEVLVNETLARKMGFTRPAEAIGHSIGSGGSTSLPIVGVMRDFHQASVRSAVAPLIYYAAPRLGYVMHIALSGDPVTWKGTIKKIETAWKHIYPDVDFEYLFLDKKIENFYKKDQQLSALLAWSAGVAIVISCLGMLGLVIFMTNRRIKEIGVRKVLGASVPQIICLLSADFARLLILAFMIAIPISWWQTFQWLQNFAYHTELRWWLFLLSGFLMILIALVIVGIRAAKAAIVNPVRSLRTE